MRNICNSIKINRFFSPSSLLTCNIRRGLSSKGLKFATEVRKPMLNPRWWTGSEPISASSYTIDCTGYDMTTDEVPLELQEKMHEAYNKTGLMLQTKTNAVDLEKISKWSRVQLKDTTTYSGGANSRVPLGAAVYDTGAPKEAHLHYHHEMAYIRDTPENLAFGCNAATHGKGFMYVSENIGATDEILTKDVGKKLRDLGVCYIRCLTDKQAYVGFEKTWNGRDEVGVYNHWQTSMGTDDIGEASKLAEKLGLEFSWGEDNYLKTKRYSDAFEYFPLLKKNLLFTSVADDSMWFDTWPGVSHLKTMESYETASMYERPQKMTYGDDSDFTREELFDFMSAYDKHGLPIRWNVGDLLVLCNIRWAHGRPSYELEKGEGRRLGVTLGKQVPRLGQNECSW